MIKTLLADASMYSGIELSLHIVCTAAVKLSVESVVESLVSRYESHFDSSRQLSEEHALEEMEIAENGQNLVNADKILYCAMTNYWKTQTIDGSWHFCHRSEDIRWHKNESKVIENR